MGQLSIMGQEIKIAPLKGCKWVKNFELENTILCIISTLHVRSKNKEQNKKNDTFWDRVFKTL